MPPNASLCSLVLDEMSIKERVVYNVEKDEVEGVEDFGSLGRTKLVANHAMVFMLKGLTFSWKQPIGYFLSSGPMGGDTLKDLLVEALRKIKSKGLQPRLVICDQGSNNRRVLETLLGATVDKPYFELNEEKIFVMYDLPHLLKNIRNNLKISGFSIGEEEISWQHIETFYKFDRMNAIRMAPKLTHRHIYVPPFAALRVKFAAQVLSHTVAAGLSTLHQLKVLPESAIETAKFVENFDQLFNSFNSSSWTSNQKMRHAFTDTSEHKTFLRDMLKWLRTINSNSGRKLPCVEGWMMAINSLLSLRQVLHQEHGLNYLFTQRLNQDCLENLFSVMRGSKGGNRVNPNAKEFREALRAAMVDAILVHSDGSNCQEDSEKFLLTLTAFSQHDHQADFFLQKIQMQMHATRNWFPFLKPTFRPS